MTEEEIDYWCEEFPDLDRDDIVDILEELEDGLFDRGEQR